MQQAQPINCPGAQLASVPVMLSIPCKKGLDQFAYLRIMHVLYTALGRNPEWGVPFLQQEGRWITGLLVLNIPYAHIVTCLRALQAQEGIYANIWGYLDSSVPAYYDTDGTTYVRA